MLIESKINSSFWSMETAFIKKALAHTSMNCSCNEKGRKREGTMFKDKTDADLNSVFTEHPQSKIQI